MNYGNCMQVKLASLGRRKRRLCRYAIIEGTFACETMVALLREVPAACKSVTSCSSLCRSCTGPSEAVPLDATTGCLIVPDAEALLGMLLLQSSCFRTALCFLCSAQSCFSRSSSLAKALLLGSSSSARCRSLAASEKCFSSCGMKGRSRGRYTCLDYLFQFGRCGHHCKMIHNWRFQVSGRNVNVACWIGNSICLGCCTYS